MNKTIIAERFSKAIATYPREANVQRQIADKMIRLLKKYILSPCPKVIEFGCGTGVYSRMLLRTLRPEELLLNDLCPEMRYCCEDLLREKQVSFLSGLAVQRQLAEPPAAAQYIQHHHKADAAQDDHPIGDKVQPKVIAVGDQAVAAAQHIEPCIVKGSDRVEHADPGGMQRRIVPGKHRVAGHRADAGAGKAAARAGICQFCHGKNLIDTIEKGGHSHEKPYRYH